MEFYANKKQSGLLSGLAFWIANKSYIRERFGDSEPELLNCHKTIIDLFDELDRAAVPFWVQNSVICWAENWRNYAEKYTSAEMKKKNIYL